MNKEAIFSTGKDDWETPDDFFKKYDDQYHFVLDAAADTNNHKVDRWLGPGGEHEDALAVSWLPYLKQGNIWLNPPYSRKLQRAFLQKVRLETAGPPDWKAVANKVVVLLPARTDTYNFHSYVLPFSRSVEFVKGRIKFSGAEHGAPFPSMIVVF